MAGHHRHLSPPWNVHVIPEQSRAVGGPSAPFSTVLSPWRYHILLLFFFLCLCSLDRYPIIQFTTSIKESIYQSINHVARKEGHSQLWSPDPVSSCPPSLNSYPQKSCQSVYSSSIHSQLGFGTWQAKPGEVEEAVFEALKAGYRHLVSSPVANKYRTAEHHLTDLVRRISRKCTLRPVSREMGSRSHGNGTMLTCYPRKPATRTRRKSPMA